MFTRRAWLGVSLALLALLGIAPGGAAEEDDLGRDVREECRSEFSGRYLSLLNDVQVLGGLVEEIDAKLGDVRAAKSKAEAALAKLKAAAAAAQFDMEREDAVTGQRYQVELLGKTIASLETERARSSASLEAKKKAVHALEARLGRVFRIETVVNPVTLTKSAKLVYKTVCPAYHLLCPLPPDESKALVEILAEKTPESCRRYAQMIPVQK